MVARGCHSTLPPTRNSHILTDALHCGCKRLPRTRYHRQGTLAFWPAPRVAKRGSRGRFNSLSRRGAANGLTPQLLDCVSAGKELQRSGRCPASSDSSSTLPSARNSPVLADAPRRECGEVEVDACRDQETPRARYRLYGTLTFWQTPRVEITVKWKLTPQVSLRWASP